MSTAAKGLLCLHAWYTRNTHPTTVSASYVGVRAGCYFTVKKLDFAP